MALGRCYERPQPSPPVLENNEANTNREQEELWLSGQLLERGESWSHTPMAPFSDSSADHSVTFKEVLCLLANRMLCSRFYTGLYAIMTLLALCTLVMSLVQPYPTLAVFILDGLVSVSMILEVILRLAAMRQNYFRCIANILDVILVFACIVLMVLVHVYPLRCGETPGANAACFELKTITLALRNIVQLGRIVTMLRRAAVARSRRRHLGFSPPDHESDSVEASPSSPLLLSQDSRS